jgi:hypothetical protein
MDDQQVVFDINAPPANATQQQAAHAEAQAQADAVNAAQHLAAQAAGARSGSTSPVDNDTNTNNLIALLIQGQQSLIQGQQQLQQMMGMQQADHVIFQQAFASAPTPLRSGARANDITTTPYDIYAPGTLGTTPAHKVKIISSLEFAKGSAKESAVEWLARVERICTFHRVDFPAAFACNYLTKEASSCFTAAFQGQDPYTIDWMTFRTWLLSSPLHDRLADQKTLDQVHSLQQGNSSVKNYTDATFLLYTKKACHATLNNYPDSFWIDAFRRGLNPEIQSRLPIVTATTTLASITNDAMNIGTPLEAAGLMRTANNASQLNYRTSFNTNYNRGGRGGFRGGRGGGGFRGGVQFQNPQETQLNALTRQLNALTNPCGPAPPATLDEQQTADWERKNLTSDQRRAARTARGACVYCGSSRHLVAKCPLLSKALNTVRFDDEEGYDIGTDAAAGPNAPGEVPLK